MNEARNGNEAPGLAPAGAWGGDPLALHGALRAAFAPQAEPEGESVQETAFERCLPALLDALRWPGDARALAESRPHLDPIDDLSTFRAVLLRLGYRSRRVRLPLARLDATVLPALVMRADGPRVVLRREHDGSLLLFEPEHARFRHTSPSPGEDLEDVLLLTAEDGAARATGSWVLRALTFFRREIAAIALLSLACNILALATPLFTAAVYNHVIGTRALDTLALFVVAILLVIGCEIHFRRRKARLVALVGARFHAALACAALERLLALPLPRIEQASAAAQMQRFRQFEGIRGFFTGALANSLLELPFTLVFLGVLAGYGIGFAAIPLALMLVFALIALLLLPFARHHFSAAGAAQNRLQLFLAESLSRLDTIHHLGAQRMMGARFEELCHQAGVKRLRTLALDSSLQAISHALLTTAGLATLGLGAMTVMRGELSTGGLIAVMMLIWRLLTPIQQTFLGFKQITQVIENVRQVDALMQLPREKPARAAPAPRPLLAGRIQLEAVAFRYPGRVEPALRAVNLAIAPGEVVAITGPAGAGKSTILKLVLGLYPPLAGAVFLDGLHLQQIDPDGVRRSIGYAPQDLAFFFGTVEQNLRLSDPGATRAALREALDLAGLADLTAFFPRGLETRILGNGRDGFPHGALARLALARAYLRRPPILLLDDPGAYLDTAGDAALIRALGRLAGRSSTLIVTNRPAHMRACTRVVTVERGAIVADGTPEAVLARNAATGAR